MLGRMKLGMFDPNENIPYARIPFSLNTSAEHDAEAYKMVQKSMVLLKNNGILPRNKNSVRKIVVVGPNANSINALRGNYYGDATNPVTVSEKINNTINHY